MPQIYNPIISRNLLDFETRRVQSNGKSQVITIPKIFTDALNIERGDLVRFCFHSADRRKVVFEKISTADDRATDESKVSDTG